jgi:hypothetical protein
MPLKPFLLRKHLYPGESLQSLLVRLARWNGLSSVRTIQDVTQAALKKSHVSINRPRHRDALQALSTLPRLDDEQLFMASVNRFVAIAHPERFADPVEVKLSMAETLGYWRIGDYVRKDSEAVYCPECLKEDLKRNRNDNQAVLPPRRATARNKLPAILLTFLLNPGMTRLSLRHDKIVPFKSVDACWL